jgi:hypothetical protein
LSVANSVRKCLFCLLKPPAEILLFTVAVFIWIVFCNDSAKIYKYLMDTQCFA